MLVDNLMLKINAKLGGLNWIVMNFPLTTRQDMIMVMGADVTHPSPTCGNKDFKKSVAAVTASMSGDLMRYVAIVRQQERNKSEEYIADMEDIFHDLLLVIAPGDWVATFFSLPSSFIWASFWQKFGDINNTLPTKVIFYRDGVSEGQFDPVLAKELAAMQAACTKVRNGYEPGFTFIVVQKRHHIRFCPRDG